MKFSALPSLRSFGYAVAVLLATNGATIALAGTTLEKAPALTGKASDLHITSVSDGNAYKVKTSVAITNVGTATAKNVLATVYLSDDAVLDTSEDTKLTTLKLADYVPGATKLKKGQTLSIPIKRKVPAGAAAFVEGKYLIAVLTADAPKHATAAKSGGETSTTLADTALVAQSVSTFSVGRPEPKGHHTDAIVPVATLKKASTGETSSLLSGDETSVQPGDELQLLAGTFLSMVTDGSWLASNVGVTLGAGTTTSADTALDDSPNLYQTTQIGQSTPSNQVVIGPIHLPR